jgi:hypothetical protein
MRNVRETVIAVNNNTQNSPVIKAPYGAERATFSVQRTAGAGSVDCVVQGAPGSSPGANDWEDVYTSNALNVATPKTAGQGDAEYGSYRLKATSTGIATVKLRATFTGGR